MSAARFAGSDHRRCLAAEHRRLHSRAPDSNALRSHEQRLQPDLTAFSVLAPTVEEEPVVAEAEAGRRTGSNHARKRKRAKRLRPAAVCEGKRAPRSKRAEEIRSILVDASEASFCDI